MIRSSYHQLFIVDDAKETRNTIKKLRDKTIRRGGDDDEYDDNQDDRNDKRRER